MSTKNFNLFFKTLKKELLLELINQCTNLENAALLLEAFENLQTTPFSFPNAIGLMIETKLLYISDQGFINEKLFVNFT